MEKINLDKIVSLSITGKDKCKLYTYYKGLIINILGLRITIFPPGFFYDGFRHQPNIEEYIVENNIVFKRPRLYIKLQGTGKILCFDTVEEIYIWLDKNIPNHKDFLQL